MVSATRLLDALTTEQLKQALKGMRKTGYSALKKAALVKLVSRLVRQRSDLVGVLNLALSKGKALEICRTLRIPTSGRSKKAVVRDMADAVFPPNTGRVTKKAGRGGKKVRPRCIPAAAATKTTRARGGSKRDSQPSLAH